MSGPLDKPMASIARVLTTTFSKVPRVLTRTESAYDPLTGVETDTETMLSVITAPPAPYRAYEIDDASIRRGDQKLFIASQLLGTFNMTLSDEASLRMQDTNGDQYRVVSAKPIPAGDDIAGYILQLRK